MTTLPAGTVTFLFTDVEDSTDHWEREPQLMSAALRRHDAILHAAIQSHNGYIFKTVGDAFCAAFDTPHNAVAAALDAQMALVAEDSLSIPGPQSLGLKVRMALHTGVAEQREGDYFGQPLNRVHRLLSVAHGGQVLLSMGCYEVARDHLPAGVTMADLGEHRLKDLVRPERIFQMAAPGLPAEFPTLRTLDTSPNNLPFQLTQMVGRAREIEALTSLLLRDDTRLVTLTGPGGTGKTRLGLQVAAEVIEHFPHGVFFVSLAPINYLGPIVEPDPIATAIAQTLGVREVQGQTAMQALKDYLQDRHALLLLDNFEQIVESAPLVYELLTSTQHLKILVTSRARLHIRGEKEFPVPPLQLPTRGQVARADALSQYEAVNLFVQRAVDVKPDFQVTNYNAGAVAEICHKLDGLPLAIELAAARIRIFSPQALLSRLESRLKVLTGGAQDLPPRQRTLRRTIEWSHDLLSDEERILFHRLAGFVGGRTLDAIEAVCTGGAATGRLSISDPRPLAPLEIDVLDAVSSLVEKSMLQPYDAPGGEPRFWMLETIQEFATECLENQPEEAAAVRQRHAHFFLALAEEAEPHLQGPEQVAWLDRLEAEHDNLRIALRWVHEQAQGSLAGVEMALRFAGALRDFWYMRGYLSEGREWLAKALSSAPSQMRSGTRNGNGNRLLVSYVKALVGAGGLAFWQGDLTAALACYEHSLALARDLDDRLNMATALRGIGEVARFEGEYGRARIYFEQSYELSNQVNDQWGLARSLSNLGYLAYRRHDYGKARPLLEESLTTFRRLGDKAETAGVSWRLALVAREEGDYPAVRYLLQEALTLAREVGDKFRVALSLNSLGELERLQGNYAEASSFYDEVLPRFQELGNKWNIAVTLHNQGHVAIHERDYAMANQLLKKSLMLCNDLGDKEVIAACLAALGGLAGATGQTERAARLFGRAQAMLDETHTHLDTADRKEYETNLAAARTQLDDATWEAAWKEGQAMTLEEAIEYALEGSAG